MKIFFIVFCSVIMVFLSGCATVFSKSSYPLVISSNPAGASYEVQTVEGIVLYSGDTPASISVEASTGFFQKANYVVVFSQEGYKTKRMTLQNGVDGWFIAGIFLVGPASVIIDGATGAMYKLKTSSVSAHLTESTASLNKNELKLYSIDDIPDDWKQHLEKIGDAD